MLHHVTSPLQGRMPKTEAGIEVRFAVCMSLALTGGPSRSRRGEENHSLFRFLESLTFSAFFNPSLFSLFLSLTFLPLFNDSLFLLFFNHSLPLFSIIHSLFF